MLNVRFFYFISLLFTISYQSKIFEILSTTDQFFNEFYAQNNLVDSDSLSVLIKRTFDWNDKHQIFKRSLNKEEDLEKEKLGVALLSNIKDFGKISTKFPNDINIISHGASLLFVTLESNGTNPENQLSNDLVLFKYSPINLEIKEVGRVPVLGGIVAEVYFYKNNSYVITAEYSAKNTPDLFQGSTLYKIVQRHGVFSFEKIQVLNVLSPVDVKFWEHQNEFYLIVASNPRNDTLRTGVLVYKWMGYHFDCIQHIPTKQVKSVAPFTIGSFLYLGISNYQDEFGNTDIHSEIFKFYLSDMKFHLYQTLNTHGAYHMAYFYLEDTLLQESEHFLVVANYIGKNSRGALTSLLESVIYKFNGNLFIPFQSFKLLGATKWLPIKGMNNEFLLLVSHSNGVRGYQYDGWRFSQVFLSFGQSLLGDNIQSMRSFKYFGDTFLTIADKNSPGNNVNLWKLSFTTRNDLKKQFKDIDRWCQEKTSKLSNDGFFEVLNSWDSLAEKHSKELRIKANNLVAEDSENHLRQEIEYLGELAEDVKEYLKDLKETPGREVSLKIDYKEIQNFQPDCETGDCFIFKNLTILKLNNENLTDFLANTWSVKDNIIDSVLDFNHLVVENNLLSTALNGHPFPTVADVTAETLINTNLQTRGNVFIDGQLIISNAPEEEVIKQEDLLSVSKNQFFEGKLVVDKLKVKNLKLSGRVNGELIENLLSQPAATLQNEYDELNVNDMTVNGLFGSINVTNLYKSSKNNLNNSFVQDPININTLEAKEIVIHSNDSYNATINDFLCSIRCLASSTSKTEEKNLKFRSRRDSLEKRIDRDKLGENILVVEGLLQADDILDEDKSHSLLHIFSSSLPLNESRVEFPLQISQVYADYINSNKINEENLTDLWVLKNSTEVQRVQKKKKIYENVKIVKKANVEKINSVDWKLLSNNVLNLSASESLLKNVTFKTINCKKITANINNFKKSVSSKLQKLWIKTSATGEKFYTDTLNFSGQIDNLNWTNIIKNGIFDSGLMSEGKKVIKGVIRTNTLNITGTINGFDAESLYNLNSRNEKKILLERDVVLDWPLSVNNLAFKGSINEILSSTFGKEWLLQKDTQIISVPVIFTNLKVKSGSNLENMTTYGVNLKRLFNRSLKTDENLKIKYVYGLNMMRSKNLVIEGTLNGANFKESVLQPRTGRNSSQELTGEWFFDNNLVVNGSFVIENLVSGINFSNWCGREKMSTKINMIVAGALRMKYEPKSSVNVNGVDFKAKTKDAWMKNENTTLKKTGSFSKLIFKEKVILNGTLNNMNVKKISQNYLSKTLDKVVTSPMKLDNLIINKWCRIRKANVKGFVNGRNITHWADNIFVQNKNQTIYGVFKFENFVTKNLETKGKLNKLDVNKEIFRYDLQNIFVEGEKTFEWVRVTNLTTNEGAFVQNVDIDFWRRNLFTRNQEIIINESLSFDNVTFVKPLKVTGKVNDINFDSQHLFLRNGNQTVKGMKSFNASQEKFSSIKIKNLIVNKLVNGLNLKSMMDNIARFDKNSFFTKAQTFTDTLSVKNARTRNLFQGINISEICEYAFYPKDYGYLDRNFHELTEKTRNLIEVAEGHVFFLDYFESIQSLKPNVRAVVPTVDDSGHYLVVFTATEMKFMEWNQYSETFVYTGDSLNLTGNVTFVTSEISQRPSILYVESSFSAKIFWSDLLKEIDSSETSCVVSFRLNALNKSCIFIGQKWNSSRILCNSSVESDLRTFQWLESRGSVQATVLTTKDDLYLAVINKEQVVDKIENSLTIYQFDPKHQHFYVINVLAEINPVAVSSIAYKGNHYLVSAGGHLPESVHNSVLSIFKLNKSHKVFVRSQSIQVDTPVDVHFALLPSSELALYVLTSNPTKPFAVFLHKGISGFVEITSGLSLYPGSNLYSFTDCENRHFVVISGFGRGQILKAEFKGDRIKW